MKESVKKEIENLILKLRLKCAVKNFDIDSYWYELTTNHKLSEDFIREFKDNKYMDWFYISKYQKLSENFIREFKNDVNFDMICKYQKLSEDFIYEFKTTVNLYDIFKYQILSENFIRKFITEYKNNININFIFKYQKLSDEFIKKFDLSPLYYNWLYKDYAFKYEKIKNCRLYEIEGEYVIAYKGIRKDNYSTYIFQYQYLPGLTYECHADHNSDDNNSFGLSAWTKREALDYCDEKLIKVKIHINDIAALVHDSNKIRCSKFTVINSVD